MTMKNQLSAPSFVFKMIFFGMFAIALLSEGCLKKKMQKEEQITISQEDHSDNNDSALNSIQGNLSFSQITTKPNSVVLTGLADHRLVTVYKSREKVSKKEGSGSSYVQSVDYDGSENYTKKHFMPGFDIIYGYYLLNIAHYDMKSEKLNYLFEHPVLIKTLYYPSFNQDSLNKKPINRDFYLVSVYDKDTNKDTMINRKDLRRFYLFDAGTRVKTQLVPDDYSVERSQYDPQNDVMYLFARQDVDKNGTIEEKEPLHVFWISLKAPAKAKLLY